MRHNEFRMPDALIDVRQQELAEFCRRNGIRKLSLFGSVLTPKFTDASDIDVLVEFEPAERVGYLRMAALSRISRIYLVAVKSISAPLPN